MRGPTKTRPVPKAREERDNCLRVDEDGYVRLHPDLWARLDDIERTLYEVLDKVIETLERKT